MEKKRLAGTPLRSLLLTPYLAKWLLQTLSFHRLIIAECSILLPSLEGERETEKEREIAVMMVYKRRDETSWGGGNTGNNLVPILRITLWIVGPGSWRAGEGGMVEEMNAFHSWCCVSGWDRMIQLYWITHNCAAPKLASCLTRQHFKTSQVHEGF